ncbi:MAG: Crp/Fnr family transcriptional regulator [Bacteroidota bacterium]|nr:Crp/Fnr family transcriptional regulator [Kiloniellaceae bacterium]
MTAPRTLDPALLDAVDVFAGLESEGRARALAAAQWTKLSTGQQAFRQDEEAEAFYVLAVGRLKVSQLTADGQEVIIRYIGPKEMFGCIAVCGGLTYPGTATAVIDSWALGWTRHAIGQLAQDYPQIALNAMRTMGGRMKDTHTRLREMQTERVERRIAHAIARLVAQAGRRVESGILIDFPVSRQDIAEMTGTTLHTVSRTLSAWQERGVVELGRQKLTVVDPHGLVVIAEDLPTGETDA